MTQKSNKRCIKDHVDLAFSELGDEKNTIIQNYVSILIQRIDELESTTHRSVIGIFAALIVFLFIKNGVLSEVEVSGIKFAKMQSILPLFPLYLGYSFYVFSTSISNAATLERIVKGCYDHLAPNMKETPLNTIFMIRTFFGAENHDLAKDHGGLERALNTVMVISIILFWAIGFLAIMLFICSEILAASYMSPVYSWILVICGAALVLRAYVYFYTHMSLE